MELNYSTPIVKVWVRNEFLYNQEKGFGEFTEGYIFGVSSMKGRALGFNVMLKTGAHFRWMPCHAFLHEKPKRKTKLYNLSELELWDCFSNSISVIEWEYLKAHECQVCLRSKKALKGTYLFTVDWVPDNFNTSFVTDPEQNKCAHIIALENGQICVLPTNRCEFRDGYFIGAKPNAREMGYKTNTHLFQAECADWDVSKSEEVFYEPSK